MRKFIVISIVLLMLTGFAITSSADVVTLYADQIVDVGTLTVVVDGDNLVVTYTVPLWVIFLFFPHPLGLIKLMK